MVGDKIYGVDEEIYLRFIEGKMTPEDEQRLRLKNQALHASSLRFNDPEDGLQVISAPLRQDMAALIGKSVT